MFFVTCVAASCSVPAFAALCMSSSNGPAAEEPEDYIRRLDRLERRPKDATSRPAATRSRDQATPSFLPLAPYFRSIPTTTCRACLKPIDDKTVIYEMPTSTGANRKMRRVGMLEFTLKGQEMKLLAFNEVGAPILARCSCRSAIAQAARKRTPPDASWISSATARAST